MICEKCSSEMSPVKIFKHSGCLVSLGAVLLFCGLCVFGIYVLSLMAQSMPQTEEDSRPDTETRERNKVIDRLKMENVPSSLILEFEEKQTISSASLDTLPEQKKVAVKKILSTYRITMAGASMGALLFKMFLVAIILGLLIPGMILLGRKSIYRCSNCRNEVDQGKGKRGASAMPRSDSHDHHAKMTRLSSR